MDASNGHISGHVALLLESEAAYFQSNLAFLVAPSWVQLGVRGFLGLLGTAPAVLQVEIQAVLVRAIRPEMG